MNCCFILAHVVQSLSPVGSVAHSYNKNITLCKVLTATMVTQVQEVYKLMLEHEKATTANPEVATIWHQACKALRVILHDRTTPDEGMTPGALIKAPQ